MRQWPVVSNIFRIYDLCLLSFQALLKSSLQSDMQLCRVVFPNLTTLSLSDWCLHGNCKALLYLLRHSPNLEKLTLKMRKVTIFTILWHSGFESYVYSINFLSAAYVLDWHVIVSFILHDRSVSMIILTGFLVLLLKEIPLAKKERYHSIVIT